MALIIRIDVDRPYGKKPLARHILSRISSDLYCPVLQVFGYLKELATMLRMLNERDASAYVFFRQCTLPSNSILNLMVAGHHVIGLHLENSRSYETFHRELEVLERHVGQKPVAVSKHGSGEGKYGLRHFPPYEPDKYRDWACRAGMNLFLGNLEDPTIQPIRENSGLAYYPSAFWLEPHWRDTQRFTIDWLLAKAKASDIVLLVHPENVLSDPALTSDFQRLIESLPSITLS